MSGAVFLYRDRGTLRATSLDVTVPPAEEPVGLPVVKQHLRLDTDVDDTLLTTYATVARMMVESYLNRVLVTQTLTWTVQEVDPRRTEALLWMPTTLELPRGKVQSVTSVTTRDATGADTVLDPSNYTVDLNLAPARLRVTYGSVVGEVMHVQIVYVAGYGAAADVPPPIQQAILIMTTFMYENRGDTDGELPRAVEWLCDPYRIHSFGG
jgi:uncharacterized phiE125 gp8 family phage protein